ncbi:MAG: GTP-binding protein, partial [Thermoflexus sp.]
MKVYRTENLRNIVLVGHNGSGKTTLVEAMLFLSGATTRMGRVEEGNTVSDFDEEEIRRRLSIYTSLVPIEWSDHKINLLDAPGYLDFVGEMKSAVHVADCALLVVDSVAGVEVGTEQAWAALEERGLPRIALISKMDRDNANF